MNINYKQAQFELFPGTPGSSMDTGRPRYLFANLNLSVENLVIGGIVILMAMVFIFSLGVEKGKKLIGQSDVAMVMDYSNPPAIASAHAVMSSDSSSQVSPVAMSAQTVMVKTTQNKIQPTAVNRLNPQRQNNDMVKATEKIASTTPSNKAQTLPQILNKPYTIQVASFKDEKYAQKEAMALKNRNFDVFVISKGNFSIVCVGKFSKKDEANGILAKLKKNYNDCLVRRL